MLYSTSTMEHHHFDHCIMILNSTVNANDKCSTLTGLAYAVVSIVGAYEFLFGI